MKVVFRLCPIILHFGIIIHPASPPTQSVLFVVWRIAPQEGLISGKCQCSRWRHFGYSIRLVLHCNFKDAETGLMAHYHKWMKHKAKLLLGKCQSIAVDLCWRRYDVKMAEHLIFHFHSICCQAKEIKLSLPNGIFWKIPHSEEPIPRMIFLGKSS